MMKKLYKNMNFLMASLFAVGLFGFANTANAQSYCTPDFMEGCSNGENINDFILVGENGTEIEDLNTGCAPGNYDDKSATTDVQLYQGGSYTIQMSTQVAPEIEEIFGQVLSSSGVVAAVWIDFNDNGEFEPNERVGVYEDYLDLNLQDYELDIPSDAAVGTHRMRIVSGLAMSMIGQSVMSAESLEPCPDLLGGIGGGDLSLNVVGEAHDYSVTITEDGATICDNFFVDLGTDTTICYNAALILDATTQGATAYSWSTGATSATINVTDAGYYTVTATGGECEATSSITVSVLDAPSVDGFTMTNDGNNSVTFTANNPVDVTDYSWSFGDGSQGSGQTVTHTYTSGGNYTVLLTVSNDCGSVIESQVVNPSTASIGSNGDLSKAVKLYPNPASNKVNIDMGQIALIDGVIVTDILGKEVLYENVTSKSSVSLNVSVLPKGTYFVRLSTDKGAVTKKLMIVE